VDTYRPAPDGGTGEHSKTEASTSSSVVANDDVTVEVNARVPMWFAKNVRQVWDRLVCRSGRYRDTVRSETVKPSLSNSPWIRGAPQRPLAVAIRGMRLRSCASMRGRPGRRRE
jgi:hypothetical protein